MSNFSIYGRISVKDDNFKVNREIVDSNNYSESVYSELLVTSAMSPFTVPFGSVSDCKFVMLMTDHPILLTLKKGINQVDLNIENIFYITNTSIDQIQITTTQNTNIRIFIAGA